MKTQNNTIVSAHAQDAALIVWEAKYATNIDIIDNQHKELVTLTNQLYQACLSGDEVVGAVFKEALSRMVEYVRFHFSTESDLLIRINYPNALEHKTQHDELVKKILEAAQNYRTGRRFVPNSFVRTLKDWVFGHIAYLDKIYASYVVDQKKKGLLNDQLLIG